MRTGRHKAKNNAERTSTPDIMPPEDDAEPLNPDQINAIRNSIESLQQ